MKDRNRGKTTRSSKKGSYKGKFEKKIKKEKEADERIEKNQSQGGTNGERTKEEEPGSLEPTRIEKGRGRRKI